MLLWVAAVSVFLGFRDVRDSLGVLAKYLTASQLQSLLWGTGVLASLFSFWYLRAILWVDRHGGWPGKPLPPASEATSVAQSEAPRDDPPQKPVP
jgi:hypothetical protein